jgi:cytochrome c-type biogenesis protein CcmE
MVGKKVKLRVIFLSIFLATIILSIILILKSLEDEIVYFISPTEIKSLVELNKKKIRVGGMVKEGSVKANSDSINFIITDYKNEIMVIYSGAIPNLFAEGKGVVAEGILKDRNFLISKKILAKHDENYIPPEVKEALGAK